MADVFDFYVYDDRSIQFTLAEPIMLEDKDVTQFRFRIPKSLNGFDMSGWEWWFVFVNPKGIKYTTLLELSDDEDEPEEYSVATYTVGYGFSGIVGTVRFSIEALNVSGEEIVNEWHTKTYSTAVIDTLQGLRAVIPEPDGQSSTGITEEVKQALLQIARKVAYIDEHGQTYYDALYNALYAVLSVKISPSSIVLNAIGNTRQLTATTVPEGANVTWTSSNPSVATVSDSGLVTSVAWGSAIITATAGDKTATCSVMVAQASVVAITADYTQSGTVYTTASLDDLKSDLTVSAEWSDGTSSIVADTDYTLSGTLTEGTSTITVNYGGQSTIFNVTVTAPPTLQSIAATYTQSGTVYDTASLDDLKSDLVVTANYSDSTSETVTDYTLSGTLAEGTSTITVSYGGKTATFNVTVSKAPSYVTENLELWIDARQNVSAYSQIADQSGNNVSLTLGQGMHANFFEKYISVYRGQIKAEDSTLMSKLSNGWTIEAVWQNRYYGTGGNITDVTPASGSGSRIASAVNGRALILNDTQMQDLTANTLYGTAMNVTDSIMHVSITYDGTTLKEYIEGELAHSETLSINLSSASFIEFLGNIAYSNQTPAAWNAFRVYSKVLTASEIKDNYNFDIITYGTVNIEASI